jgi:hypothetical protein
MRHLFCACIFLVLATATARADETQAPAVPSPSPAVAPVRSGLSAAYLTLTGGGSGGGPAGFASLSIERGPLLVSLRAASSSELIILGPSPAESVSDYGALVGTVIHAPHVSLSIAAGISMFQSVTRGSLLSAGGDCIFCSQDYAPIRKSGVGVPFALTVLFHGAYAGGGFSLFGNVNDGLSYVGFGLTVSGGKLGG